MWAIAPPSTIAPTPPTNPLFICAIPLAWLRPLRVILDVGPDCDGEEKPSSQRRLLRDADGSSVHEDLGAWSDRSKGKHLSIPLVERSLAQRVVQ